jgi:hypothetical protein
MRAIIPLSVLIGLSLALSALGRPKRGTLLGMPYNLEWPTPERARRSLWDPTNRRILSPHLFGWGYSVNLHAIARRVGLV